MIFKKTTHSYSFQNSEYDNHHYNRPSRTLKREKFSPSRPNFPKLPTGGFPSVEMQLLLPLKPTYAVFSISIFFFAVLSQSLASGNLWPGVLWFRNYNTPVSFLLLPADDLLSVISNCIGSYVRVSCVDLFLQDIVISCRTPFFFIYY